MSRANLSDAVPSVELSVLVFSLVPVRPWRQEVPLVCGWATWQCLPWCEFFQQPSPNHLWRSKNLFCGACGLTSELLSYAMMVALGEMAALLPVAGSFSLYAARFVDPALGFAVSSKVLAQNNHSRPFLGGR